MTFFIDIKMVTTSPYITKIRLTNVVDAMIRVTEAKKIAATSFYTKKTHVQLPRARLDIGLCSIYMDIT